MRSCRCRPRRGPHSLAAAEDFRGRRHGVIVAVLGAFEIGSVASEKGPRDHAADLVFALQVFSARSRRFHKADRSERSLRARRSERPNRPTCRRSACPSRHVLRQAALMISVPLAGIFPSMPGTFASATNSSMMRGGKAFGKVGKAFFKNDARHFPMAGRRVFAVRFERAFAVTNRSGSPTAGRPASGRIFPRPSFCEIRQIDLPRFSDMADRVRTGIAPTRRVRHLADPRGIENHQTNTSKFRSHLIYENFAKRAGEWQTILACLN